MLFYSGIIHVPLCGHEICKNFLGTFFPLGWHEISDSFQIKLSLLCEHEIY